MDCDSSADSRSNISITSISNTLQVRRNLLNIDELETAQDILFPDELNNVLRDRIQYFTHENGMLTKNLTDLELQHDKSKSLISDLEKKLKQYEKQEKSKFPDANEVAGVKIVELTKKLREKTAEVESLKTKNSRLQKKLFETNNLLETENVINTTSVEYVPEKVNELEEEARKLKEKLNATTNKLSETRNANIQLKNELKLANKWLQQETGDSFTSLQNLNSSGNWRGRAQLICDLQQKNSELREKLKSQDGIPQSDANCLAKLSSKTSLLSKENEDLKQKYTEIKKKNEGLKARCKVLDNELTIIKSRLAMIKEQSDRDQDIITTLTTQISSFKNINSDVVTQKDRLTKKLQDENDGLMKQLEEYKNVVKNLKDEVDSKTKEDVKNISKTTSTPEVSCNTASELRGLLLHLDDQRYLLSTEREAHFKTQALLRAERQRAARAEAQAARAELDAQGRSDGYGSTRTRHSSESDLNLRLRLELAEENVKALQTRLEVEQMERRMDVEEFKKVLASVEGTRE